MKILYSCLSKSWGGMEMFTITAVKRLLNKKISVDLLCLAESRLHVEAANAGIVTYPVNANGYFNPFSILKLSNIIRKNGYDLIHTQASKDLWVIVPALKIIGRKIPLIMTKQVGSFVIKKDALHKWIYNRVTYALAISNVIKKNLIDTCPLDSDKVLLLHNGIDTSVFDPQKINSAKVRDEFGIKKNDTVIGMMARLSPGKGHEEFLKAAKELNNEYKDLKFLIVGEASRGENEYAESVKKTAAALQMDNLIFTGFRSDTPEVLAAIDIFIFPSHNEAFGIALTEAMSMGKPSVCSDSDGILDIAVNGETSLLFETKNYPDLKKKIAMMIESPELRHKFGIASRRRAVNFFDLDILTDKVLDIYKNARSAGELII